MSAVPAQTRFNANHARAFRTRLTGTGQPGTRSQASGGAGLYIEHGRVVRSRGPNVGDSSSRKQRHDDHPQPAQEAKQPHLRVTLTTTRALRDEHRQRPEQADEDPAENRRPGTRAVRSKDHSPAFGRKTYSCTTFAAMTTAPASGTTKPRVVHACGQVLVGWGHYAAGRDELAKATALAASPTARAYAQNVRAFARSTP